MSGKLGAAFASARSEPRKPRPRTPIVEATLASRSRLHNNEFPINEFMVKLPELLRSFCRFDIYLR